MKKSLVVYIVNKNNKLVGVYKLKELIPNNNEKETKQFGKQNYENDNTLNYAQEVYDAIASSNLKVLQYKVLSQNKRIIYFLAIVDTDKLDLTSDELIKLENKSSPYNKAEKLFSKDCKKKKKEHKKAIKNAYSSNKTILHKFLTLLSAFELTIEIVLIILNRKKDGDFSYLILAISILSVFNLIARVLESVFLTKSKYNEFESTCNESVVSVINDTDELIQAVIKNKPFKYEKYDELIFENNQNEAFIISQEENINFDENATRMKVTLEKHNLFRTEQAKKVLSCIIKEKIDQNKNIFNNKLIGINTELNFSGQDEICLKKVDYFTYVSTDEMALKKVYLGNGENSDIFGCEYALNHYNGKVSLRNIEKSSLTNLIGVNLIVEIVLNEKHYYIINRQSMTNDVNQLKLVPSASGSLDLKDYKKFKKLKENNFKNLLKIAMFRELEEESYLKFKNLDNYENNFNLKFIDFKLLGFSRLVSKAGKPDFFAMVSFEVSSEDDFKNILDNYNECQNKKIGNFESFGMHIVDRKYLKENSYLIAKENSKYSPQLNYIAYLILYNKD